VTIPKRSPRTRPISEILSRFSRAADHRLWSRKTGYFRARRRRRLLDLRRLRRVQRHLDGLGARRRHRRVDLGGRARLGRRHRRHRRNFAQLNAFAAVNLAPRIAGTLEGVVTDAASGAGVAGARVRAVREDVGAERIATTRPRALCGQRLFLRIFRRPPATTTQNLALSSASGQVSSTTVQPISGATVAILNTPIAPVTTDASGYDTSPNVPAGSYATRASAGRCTDPAGLRSTSTATPFKTSRFPRASMNSDIAASSIRASVTSRDSTDRVGRR
jgi:hypothetical protein